MNESNIMRMIQLALGRLPHVKTFRNNVAQAWVGQSQRINGSGNVLIKDARPLHAGLCDGSSDLIGWQTVEITPDMVGQKVAVFLALEVKSPNGRATDQQRHFLETVRNAGGIAGIVKSPEGALDVIRFHGK